MKVGVTLFFQNYYDWNRYDQKLFDQPSETADSQIYDEELRLGDLIEPLGYDSIWTVEHHHTPYTMIPDPTQLLSSPRQRPPLSHPRKQTLRRHSPKHGSCGLHQESLPAGGLTQERTRQADGRYHRPLIEADTARLNQPHPTKSNMPNDISRETTFT